MICSNNKSNKEIHKIKKILSDNGYPEDIISKHIFNKISKFSKPQVFRPNKCTVYLRSLFFGSASLSLEKTAVENCYSFVVTQLLYVAKPMLS